MDIWSILGIYPTKELAAITAAYRAKLPDANPEDHPEQFKALRSAYEQARKLAMQAQAESESAPRTEAERWKAELCRLYEDITARRDTAAWQTLLDADFCTGLATRVQARDILLGYLMQHYFLPQPVWVLLDNFFSLQESAQELYAAFPRDFVDDAVLSGIRNRPLLPYEAFSAGSGEACDAYMRAYSRFRGAVNNGQLKDAADLLQELKSCGASHPYTLLCEARLALTHSDFAHAQAAAADLLEQLPGDVQALLLDAQLAIHAGDTARAEQELRAVLVQDPELAQAKFDLAGCLTAQEKYIEAKEIYLALNKSLPYNPLVVQQFEAVNKKVLPIRAQRYAEAPEDIENAVELAWCYHQDRQPEQAARMVAALPESLHHTLDFENLAAKVALGRGDMTDALTHLQYWEQAIRRAPDTDTENKARLPESLRLQATALAALKREPEALALLNGILVQWPQDVAAWQMKAQYALKENRLDEALEYGQHLQELASGDAYGSYFCGVVLFRMGRMQEAYRCFDAAMHQNGRDAGCLLYQCRILLTAGQWEDAGKILKDLTAAGIEAPAMDYCLARMAAHEQDAETAEKHYLALLPACRDANDAPDFAGEVFYRLVCLQYKKKEKAELLALAEEGLVHDSGSLSLMELRADLLREMDRIPEAISAYEAIFSQSPRHPTASESLGRLYQFRVYDYAKAVQAYLRQIVVAGESAELHNLIGLCYEETGAYEKAEDAFCAAIAMSSEEPSFHCNLGGLYLLTAQYAKAEPEFTEALRLQPRQKRDRIRLRREFALLYSRTGRPAEAAALLEQNANAEYSYWDLCRAADIWAAAGNAQAAAVYLARWRKLATPAEGDWCVHQSVVSRLLGRRWAAKRWLRHGCMHDSECARRLAALLCAEGHYKAALRLQNLIKRSEPENELILAELATFYWWAGNEKQAHILARQGLQYLEKHRHTMNTALYLTRAAQLYIAMQELGEAESALTQAERAPLCARCIYGGCKDALLMRILLLERSGNYSKALALAAKGAAQYPDEEDFSYALKRIPCIYVKKRKNKA